MASSINASTTAGVVTTADTSGVLNIQTAGTTAIAIDASQAVSFTNSPTVTGGTANGVAYLNGSKVLTTGSALVFDGSNLGLGVTPSAWQTSLGSRAIQFTGSALYGYRDTNLILTQNAYFDGAFKYYASSIAAGYYGIGAGVHSWYNAASGTAGNAITFTQAMTLDASGQFYLGTAGANTPSSTRTGTAWGFGSGSNNYWINAVNSTGTANHWSYVNGNGEVGKITTSGSATTYSTASDYRLKNSISPMEGALAKIALLKPCTYKWNVDGSDGEGFIAHELAEVCPNAITGEKDATREEQYEVTPAIKDEQGIVVTEAIMGTRTVPAYQGVDTSFLVATLTAAIQEQQTLITQLQADVAALKGA